MVEAKPWSYPGVNIAGGDFEKYGAGLHMEVCQFQFRSEATKETKRLVQSSAAVWSPVRSDRIESMGLGLFEWRVSTTGRLNPVNFFVRGARGSVHYIFRLQRRYLPGEKSPTRKLLLDELEKIVSEVVNYIDK